jgi:ssDNA-binding Zn-finger/Zn-ribbon topoisomerase 1
MESDIVSKKNDVLNVFDEILFKHLERLIGSRYGVGELSMNSVTISLIMLLMERENEIESFPSDEIDRYKNETLIFDFEELGFDAAQDMNIVVEEMIRKGYIHIDDDRFIPQKPTISMTRLIDLVFPQMPGMNLVAYFVQTMDEVKSKRKDLDSATSQFDQVLQMQGVPLKKGPQQSEPSKVSAQSADKGCNTNRLDNSLQNNQKVSPEKELKSPIIFGRKSSDNLLNHSRGFSTEPKVLSSEAYKGKIEIRTVDFGKPGLKEVEPDKKPSDERVYIEDEKPRTQVKLAETQPHDAAESISSDTKIITSFEEPAKTVIDDQSPSVDTAATMEAMLDSASSDEDASHDLKSTEQDKRIFDHNKDDLSKTAPFQDNNKNVKETDDDDPETHDEKEDSSINEDDIEKRIMAFEEDLALECPICKHSKVTIENTATGKLYYKCSNKECNFISWGKPHHIPCPKCNNPFLIEASNKTGKTILKCPRATCRYWKKGLIAIADNHQESIESASQKTNKVTSISRKPRRKVVRRRVVRRKK